MSPVDSPLITVHIFNVLILMSTVDGPLFTVRIFMILILMVNFWQPTGNDPNPDGPDINGYWWSAIGSQYINDLDTDCQLLMVRNWQSDLHHPGIDNLEINGLNIGCHGINDLDINVNCWCTMVWVLIVRILMLWVLMVNFWGFTADYPDLHGLDIDSLCIWYNQLTKGWHIWERPLYLIMMVS